MIDLNSNNLNIKLNGFIELNITHTINSDDGEHKVPTTIKVDLNGLPEKYHEYFLKLIADSYNVEFIIHNHIDNTDVPKNKKWYQFWK